MKVCLLTREYSSGGGIGRVSLEIGKRLESLGYEVLVIQSDRKDLIGYFKFILWGIRKRIPRGYDIYHSITPMEGLWVPKNRSVVTVLDLIAITHPDRYGGRLGSNKAFSLVGKVIFYMVCRWSFRGMKVVCISEHVRNEVLRVFKLNSSKVSVVRLGIPI